MYQAFLTPDDLQMRTWVAMVRTLDNPITSEERQDLPARMWNTAPGMSQLKLHTVRALPQPHRELLMTNLSLAYQHPRAIPSALKIITLVGIPKPEGGFRFVSLMEEWGKLLESLPVWRLRAIAKKIGGIHTMSTSNRAYTAGANTVDILWNLQTNSEQGRNEDTRPRVLLCRRCLPSTVHQGVPTVPKRA